MSDPTTVTMDEAAKLAFLAGLSIWTSNDRGEQTLELRHIDHALEVVKRANAGVFRLRDYTWVEHALEAARASNRPFVIVEADRHINVTDYDWPAGVEWRLVEPNDA